MSQRGKTNIALLDIKRRELRKWWGTHWDWVDEDLVMVGEEGLRELYQRDLITLPEFDRYVERLYVAIG